MIAYLTNGPGYGVEEEDVQRYCLVFGLMLRDMEILNDAAHDDALPSHLPPWMSMSCLLEGETDIQGLLTLCESKFKPPPAPRPARGKGKKTSAAPQASTSNTPGVPAPSGGKKKKGSVVNAKASTSGTAQTQKGPKGRKRGHSGTSDVQAEAGGEAEAVSAVDEEGETVDHAGSHIFDHPQRAYGHPSFRHTLVIQHTNTEYMLHCVRTALRARSAFHVPPSSHLHVGTTRGRPTMPCMYFCTKYTYASVFLANGTTLIPMVNPDAASASPLVVNGQSG